MKKVDYTLSKRQNMGDLITISRVSKELGYSQIRFRRAIKNLKIPIVRIGWTTLISRENALKVKRAFQSGEIKQGRKARAS